MLLRQTQNVILKAVKLQLQKRPNVGSRTCRALVPDSIFYGIYTYLLTMLSSNIYHVLVIKLDHSQVSYIRKFAH